jgi:phage terminase large subunit-like protein
VTPTWTTALPEWERRIVAGQSLVPCAPLFPEEAAASLEIFGNLRVVDQPGRPTIRECCRPWVFEFAAAVFGAYDADAGRQLINQFMLMISKKNGKSTIAPAIMLTALLRNWRENGEFFIIAPTKEVADNSFVPAQGMVLADEELSDLLHIKPNFRTIVHRNTGALLKVIAADSETVSGKKGIGILVEELWQFGDKANAENMLREAEGGLTSRPEGFVINITTQSDKAPAGVFKQRLNHFRNVRDGKVVDPRSLGVIYEFPDNMVRGEAWRDPATWFITNPNLGASVDREYLIDKFAEAERNGVESLCGFAAKHLNVEIGINLRADRWEGADYWLACAVPDIVTLDQIIERSDVCTVGIDGGGLDDLLGLAIIGRDRVTRDWLLWSHAWAHRDVLERRKSIAPALLDFEKEGTLTIYDEPGSDVADLVDYVMQVDDAGLLPEKAAVGVDQVGISEIVDELERRGISAEKGKIEGVRQGWQLANTIKTTARRLAAGTLKHGGTQLMRFAVENAKVEQKGNAILITKQTAGTAKIDPLIATFCAVVMMAKNPTAGTFIYEGEHELRFVG